MKAATTASYAQDVRLAMSAMRDYAVRANRQGLVDELELSIPRPHGAMVICTVVDYGIPKLGANPFSRGMITAAVRATSNRLTLIQLEAAARELFGVPDIDTTIKPACDA